MLMLPPCSRSGSKTALQRPDLLAETLGAVGAGFFSGIDEAVEAMVRLVRIVEPRDDLRDLYDDLFSVFEEAYRRHCQSKILNA
jgi:hypothetical protein